MKYVILSEIIDLIEGFFEEGEDRDDIDKPLVSAIRSIIKSMILLFQAYALHSH